VLAWAASTLAHTEPDAALEIIGRATRADPFNDSLHELAVEVHMARGDRPAAEAWVRHVTALYGKELGSRLRRRSGVRWTARDLPPTPR
jgi:predicted Zn-dependent protease